MQELPDLNPDWFGEGKLLSEKNDAKRYKLAAKISYRT